MSGGSCFAACRKDRAEILIEAHAENLLAEKTPQRRADPELLGGDRLALCRRDPGKGIAIMLGQQPAAIGVDDCSRFKPDIASLDTGR